MIGRCTRRVNVWLLWVVLGFVPTANAAESVPIKVFVAIPELVLDGDSIRYAQGVCRLVGIDSQERAKGRQPGQPLADEAWRALRGELLRGLNTVLVYGTDKYGRSLCVVIDAQGYVVNLWLVESGMAEGYLLDRAPFAEGLKQAESRAKAEGRGIWQIPNRERPEAYRKRMREK